MIQYAGYTLKQCRIYRGAIKNVIDIGPFAMQLPGKPSHGMSLRMSVQLGFYHLSHMFHRLSVLFHVTHIPIATYNKNI